MEEPGVNFRVLVNLKQLDSALESSLSEISETEVSTGLDQGSAVNFTIP